MTLASYDELQETGVKWLGDVPAHWNVGRFRHHFRESPEKIDKEVVGVMLSVSGYRGIEIKKYDDENRRRLDEELVNYRIVRVGQLVVNSMWLNAAGLGVSEFEGHVSPAYRCYWIGEGLNLRYIHHLMRSAVYVDAYMSMEQGIRPNSLQLSRTDLMNLPVLIPPPDEQKAISSFLDVETSKIDGLVSEQRRLIELLKEKRQAVISHAVTKGLNPNAPMKPSGIQWLGDVPQHWKVTPIKNLCYVNDGNHGEEYPKDSDSATKEDGVPFIRAGDFENFKIVEDDLRYISREKNDSMRKGNLQKNDILFVNRGATIGKVGVIDSNYVGANLNSQIAYLRVDESNFSHRFLMYYLSGTFIQETVVAAIMGGALPQYPIKHIVNLDVCHPDLDEQRAVAAHLDSVTETLDSLEAEAERAIELLQERRTALISAAVTGKINVRENAAVEVV
jgi:type I restriction enzyme S subunit